MQLFWSGQHCASWVADFTSEPGFHCVWHSEGQSSQQYQPVRVLLENVHLPRLGVVYLGSPLPDPLQGWRCGGAVIADGAVQGDLLSHCGCQCAIDNRSLWRVCQCGTSMITAVTFKDIFLQKHRLTVNSRLLWIICPRFPCSGIIFVISGWWLLSHN